ncbi:MAG: DUF1971 domain-containing protein [Pseudomonadota bacterium]
MSAERALPGGAAPYSRTPRFTEATVPQSLLREHSTKAGTHGLLHVDAGSVQYFLAGQETPAAEIAAGETFVILPEEVHFVRLGDGAAFWVEFCR